MTRQAKPPVPDTRPWLLRGALLLFLLALGACGESVSFTSLPSQGGQVLDGNGNPIVGQQVELYSSPVPLSLADASWSVSGSPLAVAKTDYAGRYGFTFEGSRCEALASKSHWSSREPTVGPS